MVMPLQISSSVIAALLSWQGIVDILATTLVGDPLLPATIDHNINPPTSRRLVTEIPPQLSAIAATAISIHAQFYEPEHIYTISIYHLHHIFTSQKFTPYISLVYISRYPQIIPSLSLDYPYISLVYPQSIPSLSISHIFLCLFPSLSVSSRPPPPAGEPRCFPARRGPPSAASWTRPSLASDPRSAETTAAGTSPGNCNGTQQQQKR